jgi:predicted nucleotidyltransferase
MTNGEKNKMTRASGNAGKGVFSNRIKILKALKKAKTRFAVIGGVALNLHGIVRATKDLDLLIPKDVKNARKILDVLSKTQTWGMARDLVPEDIAQKPFTIIGDQPRVDLLTVAGKLVFEKIEGRLILVKVGGMLIPCVNLEDLIETLGRSWRI